VGETASGRIVVVSNRLPVTLHRTAQGIQAERSSGGLVTALEPVLRTLGGTWVGWPGLQLRPGDELKLPDTAYGVEVVRLSEREIQRYYQGCSNQTLWPLFHSLPERANFDRRDWECYEAVNERFAKAALHAAESAELIWVHDYHLMRMASYLREWRPDLRLAFFLHVPFPPYDLYRILPWYQEILRGLLACDLVGFHCPGYAANFIDCVERLLGARTDRAAGHIEQGERTVQVSAFPLGIDYETHEALAIKAPRESVRVAERIVLGVDRLDYTKGIPERILAFERLLELHREHREKVVFIQVAVPSRGQVAEYQSLKRRIDELVGHVNGRFATPTWSPIHYLYRSLPPDRLAALYRDADVALVTPLRDGMNLVAKEYVACQVDAPGVLVLSRMAGAAETMHEALRVNPYNVDGMAENLHRALTMNREERGARMLALQQRERRYEVHRWVDAFLSSARARPAPMRPLTDADFASWLGEFLRDWPLALFLDYDGTLSPIADRPSEALLAPEMRELLATCARRPDSDVTVVSGRSLQDVRKLVGLEAIAYAGNHGLEISGPKLGEFRHEDVAHYEERAGALADRLRQSRLPGVWVEEKGASLTLHYRLADPSQHAEIRRQAYDWIRDSGFQARDALCAVEARPPVGWDKGHAVLHILRRHYGVGWSERVRVIYVGDDDTDEDAFRALSGLGVTFRVGASTRRTSASRHLPNVAAVRALLGWIARRP
jgi:trehalose 6-phosphate synthase/phosphatase